ncbi:MAG: T9SS type A sorting domain-containing protein [Flavobacteriaceae bacterium]
MKKHLLLLGITFLSYNFATAQCEPVSSLDEAFDGDSMPACWTGSHSYPNIMTGDKITFYSGDSGTIDIYLVSPEITAFNGQQTLTFTATGTSMSPVLQIGTLDAADNFSTFTAVGDEIALGEETTFSVDIPTSTQKFIAFKFSANGASHSAGTLDNVTLQTNASPCDPVSSLNETFDAGALPDCWTNLNGVYDGSGFGSQNILFYSTSGGVTTSVATQQVLAGNYSFTFDATGNGILAIGIQTDLSDSSTFTELYSDISPATEAGPFEVSLTENAYIVIEVFLPNAHSPVYLDNVVLETSASVENLKKNDFKLYPNPATSLLNIESTSEVKSVEIFDLTGRKVVVSTSNNTVDVSSLTSGTYIISITSENGTAQTKFVKR